MFLSILILILGGYGYVSGEVWAIVGSIILAVFLVRKTVFAFNKVGTVISFSLLFMTVIVGIMSIPDDTENEDQGKIAKVDPPRVSSERPPTKTAPIQQRIQAPVVWTIASVSEPEPHTGEPNKIHMAQLPCADHIDFNYETLGEKGVNSLYVKICPDFREMRIHYSPDVSKQLTDAFWVGDKMYGLHQTKIELTPSKDGPFHFFTIKPDAELFTTGVGKGFDYVVYHLMVEGGQAHQLMTNSTDAENEPTAKPDFEEMACVEQTHLDQAILGKNNMSTLYIKICANTEPIVVSYDKSVHWGLVAWEFWLDGITQVLNNNFVSSIINSEDNAILIIPKQAEIAKINADYVIVHFYINEKF